MTNAFQRPTGYSLAVDGVARGGVGYAYDAENRIRGIAATNAAGRSFSVAYTNDAGYNYGYAINLPNGGVLRRVVERDQFRRGLVTNCSTYHGNTLVDSYAYAYDAGGRPVTRNDDIFGYDARDQVTFAAIGTNVYTHAYDGIGNHVLSGVNSVTNLMENNQLNQLKRIVSSDGSTTNAVSWNVHGGMARDDLWTYTYDAEDQLIAVTARSRTNGAIRVRSAYDCRHRRIAKIVERLAVTQAPPPALPVMLERWDLVERRDFVWDDWNIIHEFATAVDGVSTNVTEIQYFCGLDLSDSLQGAGGVGGLLAVSRNGSFYFPVYDNNGNVMKYVDESGTVAAAYVYDDFGRIVSQTGSLADAFSFRFSTKYNDAETEIVPYQFRCYSQALRTWVNRDPIGENGGLNIYAFCLNNPVDHYDLFGLKTWIAVAKSKCNAKEIDQAAIHALAVAVRAMNASRPRVEHYGNLCCKCSRGTYEVIVTGPVSGEIDKGKKGMGIQETPVSAPDDSRIKCPKGSQLVGYYHTHLYGVNFSKADLETVGYRDHPYYMSQDGEHVQKAIPRRTDDPTSLGSSPSVRVPGGIPIPPKIISL